MKYLLASAGFIALLSGGWYGYRSFGASSAPLTTEELTRISKTTPEGDRAAWLRLGRAMLGSEKIAALAPPVEPTNNRGETSRIELGYLLFFDPILSGNKDTSCASCHHPDFAMADGMKKGVGAGGRGFGVNRAGTGLELERNTPSLFNVVFNKLNFWDGRAGTLEEQVFSPLFSEEEMNQQNAGELISRLRAIPKYREMFRKAFGVLPKPDGAEVTLPNMARALAAFERRLITTETHYDYFVKGNDNELSTEQLRGLVVFFGQGQCVVCHIPPTFHDDVVSSVGVTVSPEKGAPLDPDPGFAAVVRRQDGFGMFKTPSLRNVEKTAPYFHNGAFKTLEEVVDFYNDGGGRGRGLDAASQDSKVAKLDLTDRQKQDLVAFLKSLTDLSPPPQTPSSVPSGLPVTGR